MQKIALFTVFILVYFTYCGSSIGLSHNCKVVLQRQLEAWSKDPVNFPVRVQGDRKSNIPDIVIWDPLTTTVLDLVRPNCHLALTATRWKDGQSVHDQPGRLFCIQGHAILISHVYRCSTDHQTLAHDPAILRIVSERVHIPFVLFQYIL